MALKTYKPTSPSRRQLVMVDRSELYKGGPVKTLTEVAQKQVQQTTQQITDSIPTLPGNDPVSQGVNDSVTGVKDTIGKLTGKP